jgi:ESS family glutamate:Na+ symporter
MGLLAGSITLSGGHGTGAAWSKLFVERYGFVNATEVAMACATFGLVLGGLIGGPVARYLVKHSSSPDGTPDDQLAPTAFEKPDMGRMITSLVLIESIALIAICLTIGKIVAQLLAGTVFELPTFVCVLFIGVILSNSLSVLGLYRVFDRAVSVLGNVSLSLFLAMALMSLKLWELASLALPMIAILAVQTIAMALYAVFVTYRMMGKTTMPQCWPPVTVVSVSARHRQRLPICRRLPIVSVHRTWHFWWCRWWARSLLISSTRW